MGTLYKVLAVKTFRRKHYSNFWARPITFYQVTVNDVPGHNVITLPDFRFSGKPCVGDEIENLVSAENCTGMYDIDWRVYKKQNENTK